MVIHSDSVGMMLPFVVAFLVLTSVGMLAQGKFRQGAKALRALAGLVAVYVLFVMAVSLVTPQKIGSAGQAYCMDIWCIGRAHFQRRRYGKDEWQGLLALSGGRTRPSVSDGERSVGDSLRLELGPWPIGEHFADFRHRGGCARALPYCRLAFILGGKTVFCLRW